MTTTTATKERPILFKGEMVRAILKGKKTQTRRIMKPQPTGCPGRYPGASQDRRKWFDDLLDKCPYGQPGDRLWVRETFGEVLIVNSKTSEQRTEIIYRAENENYDKFGMNGGWKPSIFMPRALSRITLEVVRICVERLQDISEQDAIAEGVGSVEEFKALWQRINANWDNNPWVWVISFEVVT